MSQAFLCDVCGTTYRPFKTRVIGAINKKFYSVCYNIRWDHDGGLGANVDLCPHCLSLSLDEYKKEVLLQLKKP